MASTRVGRGKKSQGQRKTRTHRTGRPGRGAGERGPWRARGCPPIKFQAAPLRSDFSVRGSVHTRSSRPASGPGAGSCCWDSAAAAGPARDSPESRGSPHTGPLPTPGFSALLLPLRFHVSFVLRVSVFLQLFALFGFLFGFQFPFLVTGGKQSSRRKSEARTALTSTPFGPLCSV